MIEDIKKTNKYLAMLIFAIILVIVGATLAVSYVMDSVGMNIGTAALDVVYTGQTSLDLSNVELLPIADSEVDTNVGNIIQIDFTLKGASSNPSTKTIIYDVALVNLQLDCALLNSQLKWQLYKNGSLLSSGNIANDTIVDGRYVLTEIQQDLKKYSETPDSYTFKMWISNTCTENTDTCNNLETVLTDMEAKVLGGELEIELYTESKKPITRTGIPSQKSCLNPKNLADMIVAASLGRNSWEKGASGVYSTNNGQDYRYIGADVDNWVRFNDDYYRIIGVFDENTHGVEGQQLVKLIMAKALFSNSWGIYNSSNTSGTYNGISNDWTGSTTGTKAGLNVLLNEFFYKKIDSSSDYGKCSSWTNYYSNKDYKTHDCSVVKRFGLSEESRRYIQNVTWYLYGYSSSDLSKSNFYMCERGKNASCKTANSGKHSATTNEYIGLMYVSDYMYACGYYGSSDTTTGTSSYYGNQNWLYSGYDWMLTPASNVNNKAFAIDSGPVAVSASFPASVRPSFYLKSDVYVVSGTGRVDNPYILGIIES